MNGMPPRIAPRRTPEPGEASWQCMVSGRLFVDSPDPFDPEPEREHRPTLAPRCPCHQRRMRRALAPWYGCPGWVPKATLLASVPFGVWNLLSALCLMPGVPSLLGHC
jgi:hypothetical protein